MTIEWETISVNDPSEHKRVQYQASLGTYLANIQEGGGGDWEIRISDLRVPLQAVPPIANLEGTPSQYPTVPIPPAIAFFRRDELDEARNVAVRELEHRAR